MNIENIKMNDIRARNEHRKKSFKTQATDDVDALLFFADWAMDSIGVLTKAAIAIQDAEAKSKAIIEEKLKNIGS